MLCMVAYVTLTFMFRDVEVGCAFISIIDGFLSGRVERIVVDGVCSQGTVLVLCFFAVL